MPQSTTSKTRKSISRQTHSDLSLTKDSPNDLSNVYGLVDGKTTLRITPELYKKLENDKVDPIEFISKNLNENITYLELVSWSKAAGSLPGSLYESILSSSLDVKKLILRGRGSWTPCRCPDRESKAGELIDTVADRGTTVIEHLIIIRTFTVSSCALLDLVSRSPKLKTVRFYGSLANEDHNEFFESVRFVSELEGVYWPWCNAKKHRPTLRTMVKRNDQIKTFYTTADIVCEFLNSQLLPHVKNLSLIMNEHWIPEPGKTKVIKRYIRNIGFLESAKKVEALEVRTFDLNLALSGDEKLDSAGREFVRQSHEEYKLKFWESVSALPELKYISIHGAWELEEVCREISRRGIEIEFFRVSLMPNSILANVEGSEDNSNKDMVLSMSNATKHISKLAKLRSLHFTCHDNLANIDKSTSAALRELGDIIWKIELKCLYTQEIEDLFTNMIRRGNQNGRSYRIRLVIRLDDAHSEYANIYAETVEKFSPTTTLRESLNALAAQKTKERFGRACYKTYSILGIEQASGGRDKATFDQLSKEWSLYEDTFRPMDMFM